MNQSHNYCHINKLRFILFLCGTLTVLLGVYATVPRLVGVATEYFSPDKQLSERGIAWLSAFRTKMFLVGATILGLSLFVHHLVRLFSSLKRLVLDKALATKIDLASIVETARRLTHGMVSFLYRAGTNERFVWSFVLLAVISIQVPGIWLTAFGGLHAEGIELNVAKNLARHGVYGTLSTGGFDEFTYRESVGPGFLVLHALVFRLFGVSVYYSRGLYVAYTLALVLIFYRVGRSLYGKEVALLATVMVTPFTIHAIMAGSDGYKAALVYLLLGAMCWFKAVERGKWQYLVMSGVFWGLAFQTKWLFLFAIFAVFLTWVILRLWRNPLPSRYWIIPCSMVVAVTAIWVGFRIYNIGLREEYFHLLRFWREHGHRGVGASTMSGLGLPSFATFRPIMNLSEVDLWGELQLFLLVPSLIYIAMLTVKERMKDYKSLYLLTFVILWLLWWLLFNAEPGALLSIHLYSARFLAQLFVAKFLYDVWDYASQRRAPSSHTIILTHADRELMLYPLKLVVIIVIITTVVPHLIREASDLYFKNVKFTNAFNEMVRYIGNNTEKDAVFSGWDWSLPWHLDLDNGGDRIIKDRATYPPEHREGVSEYFIVSPEWPLVRETDEWPNVSPNSEWGLRENAMRKGFLEKHASLVRSFPAGKHKWMLFKINDTSVAHPASESQSSSPTSNSVQNRLSPQIN